VGERPLEIELTIAYSYAEDGWLTAMVPALPGTITAGRSREEARSLVLDALAEVLRTPDPERVAEADEIELVRVRLAFDRPNDRHVGR
jgi:predicted RNase H-like HicB family nuclease